ncbi:MAG: MFS transporter [Hyphomicrobiaceae bacterium]
MSTVGKDRFGEQPYGWVIVAVATVCLALGFGANITVSVFMKPFEEEFGWLRADISMAYSMLTVGAAIGGLVWGSLSDRIGAKSIGFLGAIAISAGLIALRWQSDLWLLYLLYFLIGALGFACLFTPLVALSGLWFNERKGLAIGIVTAGGAIGQGVVPYLTRLMITEVGWRDAALYLGLGYLIILVPLLCLLQPRPSPVNLLMGSINPTATCGMCRTRSLSLGWRWPAYSAAFVWLSRLCIWCRLGSILDAVRKPPQGSCCR